jgi:hypothetical protein
MRVQPLLSARCNCGRRGLMVWYGARWILLAATNFHISSASCAGILGTSFFWAKSLTKNLLYVEVSILDIFPGFVPVTRTPSKSKV